MDVPTWDEDAERVLTELFGFHPTAVRDCKQRNYLPVAYSYPDHDFVILHTPMRGEAGHVHLIELDQFIGERYLVTVHGPVNPAVPLDVALRDTRKVALRLDEGRLHPSSPAELSYHLVSAIALRQTEVVAGVAGLVPELDKRVMEHDMRNPEPLL